MRAEVERPYTSFRSTVYCQSLPAPVVGQRPSRTIGFHGNKRLISRTKSKINGAPKLWAFQRSDNEQVGNQQRKSVQKSFTVPYSSYQIYTGLDQNTMHWKSWTSYKEDCNTNHDLSMYKITQDVFRKLTMQVKEANQQFKTFTGSGFKTYQTVGDKNIPVIKPSQLASNIQVHSPSVSIATEDNPDKISTALITKRIVKSKIKRPHSTTVLSRRHQTQVENRPHSTMGSLSHHRYADPDFLTPNIIGALSGGEVTDWDKEFPGPFDIVAHNSKPCESEQYADYESDDEIDEELKKLDEKNISEEEEDFSKNNYPQTELENPVLDRFQKMFEYDDEDVILEREQILAEMKPEKVDEEEIMFDYHESSSPYKPQEEFPEALSEPFCHMDLLELSLLDKDWRTVVRNLPEKEELAIIQRMIEMERTQLNTEKWERKESLPSKRSISSLQERSGWNADAILPTERARSALARSKANKNCSNLCLDVLCAGDCSTKKIGNKNGCLHCRQQYCNGSCIEYGYHLYVRKPKDDEGEIQVQKSCKSCRNYKKLNNINSNQMIMGRPKSAFATFNSTKHQSAKPKPMKLSDTKGAGRVRSAAMSNLGLKEPSRASTGKKRTHDRGRNAIIPGKSYQSQRKNSLTDDPLCTSAAKMNPRTLIQKKKSRPKSVK